MDCVPKVFARGANIGCYPPPPPVMSLPIFESCLESNWIRHALGLKTIACYRERYSVVQCQWRVDRK